MGRPVTPPQGKPVTELRTPNLRDGFAALLVSRQSDFYQNNYPIPRGVPYAKLKGADSRLIKEFLTNPLYFLKETRPGAASSADFGTSDIYVLWVFATRQIAQSNYNADIDYPGEDVTVSRYARSYETKRQDYEANPTAPYGSTLTALVSVAIGNPGTSYTQATGTVGMGAIAEAVCYNGQIIDWIITKDGTGVTTGTGLTITGDGTGATATARVQPLTAILTHQEKKEYGDDNPRSHDYVNVIRVYGILPGPWLPNSRIDDDLGRVQEYRRAVVYAGQLPSNSDTGQTTYTARDGSSYVAWEIVQSFGAGIPGGDFPALAGESQTETVRGRIVDTESQIVPAGTDPDTGALVISSVVVPVNSALSKKTTVSIESLPPDEVVEYWDYVSIPTLLFDIVHTIYCNDSSQATVVTNPDTAGSSSVLRKHRRTIKYWSTDPTEDLSSSSFEAVDIQYQGKIIGFSYANVLNDAISYDQDFSWFSGMGVCFWTEAYDFPASTPSATDFAAGDWYVKSQRPREFGQSMWITEKIEFYSAPGEPPP